MNSFRGPGLIAASAALFFSAAVSAAGVTSYVADGAQSRLDFTGVQAGAEFKGVFHKFTAAVDFSADALATSHFDVQIDLGSEDSSDKDRDQTIKGPDIFDVAHNPTAHYVTKAITKTANGYSAVGALTLHGVTKDVPIDFSFRRRPAPPNSRAAPSSNAWILASAKAIGKAQSGSPTP